MKKLVSMLMIVLLILMVLPLTTLASQDELIVQKTENYEHINYIPDEIVVKYVNDNKPFRIEKVAYGQVKEKVKEYSRRQDVIYAEPNYIASIHAFPETEPNDPYYNPYQWHLMGSEYGGMNAAEAWAMSDGTGIVVAVIDTGVAYENYDSFLRAPDLANTHFIPGFDFVNNDNHANDDEGHGTHVAGTIAQSTNNGVGVAGVAYGASIMPIKVLNKRGKGTYTNIANGIIYAADHGANVINMSLGGTSGSETLLNAVMYAHSKGVTIVASSGNDGTGTVGYPAAYDAYVIAVGATGATGINQSEAYVAPYSNYGSALDLLAPGGDTSVDNNNDGYNDGVLQNTFGRRVTDFGYYFYQGTSMASPHVAGAAALLLADGYASSPYDVELALSESAVKIGSGYNNDGWDSYYGYGLIDAKAALQWSRENFGEPVNNPPVIEDLYYETYVNEAVSIDITGSDEDVASLEYVITQLPLNGSVNISGTTVIYTPNSEFIGLDSFQYEVTDNGGLTDQAIVEINVIEKPVISLVPLEVIQADYNLRTAGRNEFVSAIVVFDVSGFEGLTLEGHWMGATSDIDIVVVDQDGIARVTSDEVKYKRGTLVFEFVVTAMKDGGVEQDFEVTGSTLVNYPQ